MRKSRYRYKRYMVYLPKAIGDRLDTRIDYVVQLFGPAVVLLPKGLESFLSRLENLEKADRGNATGEAGNYAYDPNGNPTSVNGGQETYSYDALNRLTNATGPFGTLSYTYDQVGNRLLAVVNGTGTNYSYGSYNKLQSAGSTTYTYDNNGNTLTKTIGSNSWAYSYD